MKIYAAVVVCCLLSLACHKNQSDQPLAPPTPTPPTVTDDSVKTSGKIDSVTSIVACTMNSSSHVISVFNADGSLRWKKYVGGRGGLRASTSYSNGRLFYTYGSDIYAFNIINGDSLWKGYGETVVSATVARDGGVYACSTKYGFFQVAPASGALLNSVYIPDLVPYPPCIKDSIAYLVSSTYTASYSVTAYDLKNKTIKWSTGIGYNPPAGLTVSGNILCLRTGASFLMGININTGNIQWTLKDVEYNEHLVNNNVVYAAAGTLPKSLVAVDLASGAILWRWQKMAPVYYVGGFYTNNDQLVFEAEQNERIIRGVKKSNGDSLWAVHQSFKASLYSPVVAGGKVFRYKSDWEAPYEQKIMIYDAATYKIRDSIKVEGDNYHSLNIITKSEN